MYEYVNIVHIKQVIFSMCRLDASSFHITLLCQFSDWIIFGFQIMATETRLKVRFKHRETFTLLQTKHIILHSEVETAK